MEGHQLRSRMFHFWYFLIAPFIIRIFNYKFDDMSKIEGPYILVSNHNTDLDPIFLSIASNRLLYFVATEKVTRMGFIGFLIRRYFKPIIHYKGKMGINTVKDMLAHLKAGYRVAVFPEGNRSFNGLTNDFVSTIGKLAKKSGASLVTFRLNGAYFSSPRWGKGIRRGKIYGQCVNVYQPDQLAQMSESEINTVIKNDISEDAYALQESKHQAYKGRNKAVGLESTLFACPKCRKIGSLYSRGDEVSCECGFHAIYDTYGYLNCDDGSVHTITEYDLENRKLIHDIAACPSTEILFSDSVYLDEINEKHKIVSHTPAELKAYTDRIEVNNQVFMYSSLNGFAVQQRNTMIFYADDKHYEINGDTHFSALKYLYLYNEEI